MKNEIQARDLLIYRFVHDMNRQELADKLGVSYSYIHNLEKEYSPFTSEVQNRIRERLGLTDYRLQRLRSLYEQMKRV